MDKKLMELADLLKSKSSDLNFSLTNSKSPKSGAKDEEEEPSDDNHMKFIIAILLIIIVAGLIGNVLNLIVFCKKSMRKSSTFRFLCYLSAADLLVLLFCSTELVMQFAFSVEIRIYSVIVCRLHTFLTYFLTHISSVILMIISVDRALVMSNRSLTLKGCFKRKKLSEPRQRQMQTMIVPNDTTQMTADMRLNSLNSSTRRSRSSKLSFLCDPRIHRVDIVMLIIALVIALLNLHYILFLNINLRSDKQADFGGGSVYAKKSNASSLLAARLSEFSMRSSNSSQIARLLKQSKYSKTTTSATMFPPMGDDFDKHAMEESILFNTGDSSPYTGATAKAVTIARANNKTELWEKYENSVMASNNQNDDATLVCFPQSGTFYYAFLDEVWLWIDICVYSFIPFIVMSICSAIILIRIRKNSQTYMKHLSSNTNQSNFVRRLKRNRQLLYMLLITNLYFFISILPYCVFFVMKRGKKSANLIQLSVHILCYTNNAINFIFYGLSSQKYREELKSLFCPASNLRAKPISNRPANPTRPMSLKAPNTAEFKPAPKKLSIVNKNSSKIIKHSSQMNGHGETNDVAAEQLDNKFQDKEIIDNSGGNISNDNHTNLNSILEMNETKSESSKNSALRSIKNDA